MLWTLAWRNVWRNKKRSGVIVAAIACGLWGGLLISGLFYGMQEQMVRSAISDRTAHIQIHAKGFLDRKEIGLIIPDGHKVLDSVRRVPGVKYATGRVVISGMASSPTTATGVMMYGIVPSDEEHISDISTKMVDGTYFQSDIRNPIIAGKDLVKKLALKEGNKTVLTAQDLNGDISAGAFRITGIFKTVSSQFDKTTIFANRDDLARIFNLDGQLHEIAIIVDDINRIPAITAELQTMFPNLSVESWEELAPELSLMTDTTMQFLVIFIVIVLLALAFGTTNTMLMGVIERVRELGVIVALGMSHGRIFLMIVLETVFLAITGGVVGMILSYASIEILYRTGINLSIVSKGLAAFGSSEILRPILPWQAYPIIGAFVVITAIIAAIYPAIKAIKLNPVEAIRTI
jgi:ABC-type lipoprotein release transport system permease subunit